MKTKLHFNESTNSEVRDVLTKLEASRRRVRIWYGDGLTGLSWNEEHHVMGTIGKSTGESKIPILLCNTRSFGGGAILDHCIIRIDDVRARTTLYKHKKFHTNLYRSNNEVYEEKRSDGLISLTPTVVARFPDNLRASNYIEFMEGTRYSK